MLIPHRPQAGYASLKQQAAHNVDAAIPRFIHFEHTPGSELEHAPANGFPCEFRFLPF